MISAAMAAARACWAGVGDTLLIVAAGVPGLAHCIKYKCCMDRADAEVAAYIGRWRPSSVSPRGGGVRPGGDHDGRARRAGAGEEPAVGGGQARRLRRSGWAWTRCRRWCCTRRWPSGSPGARRACPGVARRTLRTNLRFIGRRVVPQLYPADAAAAPGAGQAAVQPGGDRRVSWRWPMPSPRAERRMRAAGLVCLGAGAGLIRGDLREVARQRRRVPVRRGGGHRARRPAAHRAGAGPLPRPAAGRGPRSPGPGWSAAAPIPAAGT